MDGYMSWLSTVDKVYFHNLAFDGAFIMDWLFVNGFTYSEERGEKTFNIIKADTNALYLIDITWWYKTDRKFGHTEVYDSLKKIPFSVERIAQAWKLPISKLEIDYTKERPIGYIMDAQEEEYVANDVKIVAYALQSIIYDGNNRMTIGSDAMAYFKTTKSKALLSKLMPAITLEQDAYFRKAYKGGFTYADPRFKGKTLGPGIVLDVNSLYPSRMRDCPMPYGDGVYYSGEYPCSKEYPLFICHVRMNFKLKKKHIPCIQLKNNPRFVATEYLETSDDTEIDLWLSSVDYNLILEQYDILSIEFVDGFMFKSCNGVFDDYIDHFMEIKMREKGAKREEAKLFLNNLYGKLATNPIRKSKVAYYDHEKKIVKYELGEEKEVSSSYIPMGLFITAYARYMTISTAQKLYPRFIYADTDSLHLTGEDVPAELEIHPSKLGAWDHECTFVRAKYLRAKTYVEEIEKDGEIVLKVTCAGMPAGVHKHVTFDNFVYGMEYKGKLMAKVVEGGVILQPTTFKIK